MGTSIFLSFAFNSFSQVAPGIEWRKITHSPKGLDGQPQDFDHSGEEWWYSHKNALSASGEHTAYVTSGYTSLVSTALTFTVAQDYFNEGSDSPYNPVTAENYNYNALPEGCHDRDYLGEHRTPPRGNIGMNALNGDMIYCRPKTIGQLEEVIQDEQDRNYFYVVGEHLGVRPYRNKTAFIPYNPNGSGSLDYFSLSAMGVINYSNSVGHMYVAKIHQDGTVIWEGLYGYADYSPSPIMAYETRSYGYDIIKSTNGNLVVTGFANNSNLSSAACNPLLLEINPANGYLLKKVILPNSGNSILPNTNTLTAVSAAGVGKSIVETDNGSYAVACTYYYSGALAGDNCNAYIWNLTQDLLPSPYWVRNPIKLAGDGNPYFDSNIWEVKWHKASHQLMAGVVRDCKSCSFAGQNSAQGYIYRFDQNGVMIGGGLNPSPMGPISAFDLRIGVEETSDGGFVAVSSTRPPGADHSPATKEELGYLYGCAEDLDFPNWDSDALIVKFNGSGQVKWFKAFDVGDNRARKAPPGDLKRQECMYKITEAQSGGYVICGNSSGNFDDFYMAKLYDDCNAQNTFTTGPGYVIDIKENVVWDSSQYVLGKIVVHPGVSFTIKGDNTKIRFADTKLTGIETNITVMFGGTLSVTENATLSPIESCNNSNWDGIKSEPFSAESNKLLVFPNPAGDNFYMYYSGAFSGQLDYTLTDVFGKKISGGEFKAGLVNEIVSAGLSEGVYFINLINTNIIFDTKKLVIVKQ